LATSLCSNLSPARPLERLVLSRSFFHDPLSANQGINEPTNQPTNQPPTDQPTNRPTIQSTMAPSLEALRLIGQPSPLPQLPPSYVSQLRNVLSCHSFQLKLKMGNLQKLRKTPLDLSLLIYDSHNFIDFCFASSAPRFCVRTVTLLLTC